MTAAHCSNCHLTFSGVSLFDTHRSADGEHGACLDPESRPEVFFFRNEMWRGPEWSDNERLEAYGIVVVDK